MRIGKGKHLKGKTLMGGIITPEEFDHFHEVSQSLMYPRISLKVSCLADYQHGVIPLGHTSVP